MGMLAPMRTAAGWRWRSAAVALAVLVLGSAAAETPAPSTTTTVAPVAAIPLLYEEFGWGPLARILPSPFFEIRLLQIRLWQWIGLGLLAVLAWIVSRLARGVLVRAARWVIGHRPGLDAGIAEEAAA